MEKLSDNRVEPISDAPTLEVLNDGNLIRVRASCKDVLLQIGARLGTYLENTRHKQTSACDSSLEKDHNYQVFTKLLLERTSYPIDQMHGGYFSMQLVDSRELSSPDMYLCVSTHSDNTDKRRQQMHDALKSVLDAL